MDAAERPRSSSDIAKLSKVNGSSLSFVSFERGNGGGDLWAIGSERKSSLSSLAWSRTSDASHVNEHYSIQVSSSVVKGVSDNGGSFLAAEDTSVFSSSLPALFQEQLILSSSFGQSADPGSSHLNGGAGDETFEPVEEMEAQTIGDLLPDDEEELLAGIADGIDFLGLPNNTEESEDVDLFSSGGGLELDGDFQDGFGVYMNNHMGLEPFSGGIGSHHGPSNGPGSVIGEHPYGEHPSRTLFVRNINSNVEDSELRALFEQYGAIRTLYTACKHRGFVMISYYDIRSARSAMRALQNKQLKKRKLDIHFSIPKDNPSDKDVNQGTLVVFNLDASVSNDDLRQIFGAYGEVKEIRETPHKRHHKFIEFYDIRAAEAALRALNRSDIAGKRIKLEPSRPGGARRSLMQQLSHELEQEEACVYRQQGSSPHKNSPPGHPALWGHVGSPMENGSIRGLHHPVGLGALVPGANNSRSGIAATLPHTTSVRVGTIGSHLGRNSQVEACLSPGPAGPGVKPTPANHPHSFPEHSNDTMPFYTSPAPILVRGASTSYGSREGVEGIHLPRTTSATGNDVSLFEHAPGAIRIPSSGSLSHLSTGSGGSSSLTGPQFLWGNPNSNSNSNSYQHTVQNSPPVIWSTSAMGHTLNSTGHIQPQAYGYSGTLGRFVNPILSSHRHHVGSAPSGDPCLLERHLSYLGESPDISFIGPGSLGAVGMAGNGGNPAMNMGGGHGILNTMAAIGTNGGFENIASHGFGVMSPRRRTHVFQMSGLPVSGTYDGIFDRGRSRRTDSTGQGDNKKLYQLDIDRILRGEDTRTTLMIKNIPNKYTSKMLLAAIDENHRGTYDFLYLPIDFKNKCNVGYAFINMTAASHIVPFFQAFNGKKWEKFNSEKVASLAYARIQGKVALVAHFQNSSLMNEDKRCRPILFHSEGPEAGDQEPFPLGVSIRSRVGRDQNGNGDFMESPTGSSIKDDSVPGSVGSSSGGMVSSSPEKERD